MRQFVDFIQGNSSGIVTVNEGNFPHRWLHTESRFPIRERDIEEMDDAGAGLADGIQPNHDLLHGQVCGLTRRGSAPDPEVYPLGLTGEMENDEPHIRRFTV